MSLIHQETRLPCLGRTQFWLRFVGYTNNILGTRLPGNVKSQEYTKVALLSAHQEEPQVPLERINTSICNHRVTSQICEQDRGGLKSSVGLSAILVHCDVMTNYCSLHWTYSTLKF